MFLSDTKSIRCVDYTHVLCVLLGARGTSYINAVKALKR
jgi:hypothetical protein